MNFKTGIKINDQISSIFSVLTLILCSSSLVGTYGDDCLEKYFPDVDKEPVGSWTSFMKTVTNCSTTKCKLEYLPLIPLPPGNNVIKWYMDIIMQIADDLELDYIFAHADEAINSKMLIISWLNLVGYDKIIPLMGGFHTILVNLKILFKKYGCLGFKDWWVDAGAIADGSVVQTFEGRHYAEAFVCTNSHSQPYCGTG